MPLPRLKDIEVALLRALVTLGGQAPTNKVYPEVTKQFPESSRRPATTAGSTATEGCGSGWPA